MKAIGQDELRAIHFWGAKSALRALLLCKPVNRVLLALARPLWPRWPVLGRLPVNRPSVEFKLPGQEPLTLVDPARCELAKEVFWGRGRRAKAADDIALQLFSRLSSRAQLCLDIGAYTGLYALVAARGNPGVRVLAFELLPANFELLERNLQVNALQARVEARLAGVGAVPGSVTMPGKYGGSVLPSSLSLGSRFSQGVCVPVLPLDQLIAPASRSTDVLIKLDVEGFEQQVLQGGRQLLAQSRPDLLCEVLASEVSGARELEALLPEGYRFYQVTASGLMRRDCIRPSAAGRDWLLTARSDTELEALCAASPAIRVDGARRA